MENPERLRCPRCKSERVVPIIYGDPLEDQGERSLRGEVKPVAAALSMASAAWLAETARIAGGLHRCTLFQERRPHRFAPSPGSSDPSSAVMRQPPRASDYRENEDRNTALHPARDRSRMLSSTYEIVPKSNSQPKTESRSPPTMQTIRENRR